MSTWSNIPDDVLEPGKPIRSVDAIALRNNPIAIAMGAWGAPRIRTIALQPPVAGNNFVLWSQNAELSTTDQAYAPANSNRYLSANRHVGVLCLVAGSLRFTLEHRRDLFSDADSFVRIIRNGTQIAEWFNGGHTFISRSVDVSVNAGDQVIFQHRATVSGGSGVGAIWRNLRVSSATPDMAVA